MPIPPAVRADGLTHRYGDRVALSEVSFSVPPGAVFGLLGPNGGGKTTLFRILSTLIVPTSGRASVFGHDLADPAALRRLIGVVFQEPALDRKLSVRENLRHHGHLYGLSGPELRRRSDDLLGRFGVADRADERVERLSGGLRRRVELAKALLPAPALLLMDEPSTGLDPGARRDLWEILRGLAGTTILLTTHLLDEADRCSGLAILHQGRLVATGTPEALRSEIGGDVVTVATRDPEGLAKEIGARFSTAASVVDGSVRIEGGKGHELAAAVAGAFPAKVESVTVGRPTLEDVFIRKTGHRLHSGESGAWSEDGGR